MSLVQVLLLAAKLLSDLGERASTIPELTNLRKRFLEPAMDWLVRRILHSGSAFAPRLASKCPPCR